MSSNKIKLIAFITMIIDHTNIINAYTPVWFHWIGRISAPLFIFTTIWSFTYTHNKINYMLRLYISSVIMGFINLYFHTGKNIFQLLFSVTVVLYLIDLYKNKNIRFKKYTAFYIFYQIITIIFIGSQYSNTSLFGYITYFILPAFTGSIIYLDFGYIFVILGAIIYLCKDNKKDLITYYSYFCLFYLWITSSNFLAYFNKLPTFITFFINKVLGISTRYNGESMFRVNFQWMMIFALPFMLRYNHKKGLNWKYFYYIAYPIHIILFTLLSNVFYLLH